MYLFVTLLMSPAIVLVGGLVYMAGKHLYISNKNGLRGRWEQALQDRGIQDQTLWVNKQDFILFGEHTFPRGTFALQVEYGEMIPSDQYILREDITNRVPVVAQMEQWPANLRVFYFSPDYWDHFEPLGAAMLLREMRGEEVTIPSLLPKAKPATNSYVALK